MDRSTPHRILFATLLALALGAQVALGERGSTSANMPRFEEPPTWTWTAGGLKAAFLGHDVFAASVAWSAALVYFGDWRLSHVEEPPKHLLDYAELISSLDPDFEPIYVWLNTTYINARKTPQREDLHTVAAFLDTAMERFPSKCEYPFMAGSNYVGYSVGRSPRERLEEIARAISYYERASLLDGCPPLLPFTLGYFYRRRRVLLNQLDATAIDDASSRVRHLEFLKTVFLLSTDDEVRKRARSSLLSMGVDETVLKEMGSVYTRPLERARARTLSYLPLDTWTLVAHPTEAQTLAK